MPVVVPSLSVVGKSLCRAGSLCRAISSLARSISPQYSNWTEQDHKATSSRLNEWNAVPPIQPCTATSVDILGKEARTSVSARG